MRGDRRAVERHLPGAARQRADVDFAHRLRRGESRAGAPRCRSGASRRARATAIPGRPRDRRPGAPLRASRSTSASAASSQASSGGCAGARKQRRLLALDQRRVEIGAHERSLATRRPRNSTLLATPTMRYCASALFIRASALGAIGAVDDQLGDHRVVERRDRVALLDAGVDAHRIALRRRREMDQAPGRRQEALVRDPRRRCAPRSRGREMASSSCVSGSASPKATRSCHSTRSSPVIISVTGCSTCRRVFISMK